MNSLLVVGSYASESDDGIVTYTFNDETGIHQKISSLTGISNPSYLNINSEGNLIYAVGEDEGLTSTIHSISLNVNDGNMILLNHVLSNGGAPCYITLSPNEDFVVTANYCGGSITISPLKDGQILPGDVLQFKGKGTFSDRQEAPHLHTVYLSPDNRYLFATDLGTDKIYRFPIHDNLSVGECFINFSNCFEIPVSPGSGPRHITFHPNGKFMYVINELDNSISVFSYSRENGDISLIYKTPIREQDLHVQGTGGAGDIHISKDGRYLYASVRLNEDGIGIFSIDQSSGILSRIGYQLTGIHPRNFYITENNKFLLCACRDDNEIQIYQIQEDGLLSSVYPSIKQSKPVCIKMIKLNQ